MESMPLAVGQALLDFVVATGANDAGDRIDVHSTDSKAEAKR